MSVCDCERSHNGIGLGGRECDCPLAEVVRLRAEVEANDSPAWQANERLNERVRALLLEVETRDAEIARLMAEFVRIAKNTKRQDCTAETLLIGCCMIAEKVLRQ